MDNFNAERMEREYELALEVDCPLCDAHRGEFCFDKYNFCHRPHLARLEKAYEKMHSKEIQSERK